MEFNSEINEENISRFSCKSCGADMFFDPSIQKLQCGYCENTESIQTVGGVKENSYIEYIEKGSQTLQPMALATMQVECNSCGAIINFTPPQTTEDCDFCGADIVAQPKATDPLVAPNGILPLLITPEKAKLEFKNWVGSLWFAPRKLKSLAREEEKRSIYIPYWTYDARTHSNYAGQRGDYYYVTETYRQDGKTKTRRVRKTRWSYASGQVARKFDDVLIPATESLPRKYLNELKPWGLENVVSYNPAFLAGHKAQTYQVALDEGYNRFGKIAEERIRSDVRSDIGGDEQRISELSIEFSHQTFKHILLPVYSSAYRFKGKVFQVFVNGRTGEVQGERPYSWLKIAGLILLIIIVIIALLFALDVF